MSSPDDAVDFLRQASDAESDNRQLGLTALQFRYGDQWPHYAVVSRGLERPQLTINETNTYIKKVTNAQRQQRPRGKASPVDSMADTKVAKVITGVIRHIEVNSDADNAYDTAFDFSATIGWGYWRLRTDFIAEDSDKQDIFVDTIANPFTVYGDFSGRLPDGSDWERCLVTDLMRKTVFAKEYPGAQMADFNTNGTGDSLTDWLTENDIRIAEYFFVERMRAKLLYLSNGTPMWEDMFAKVAERAYAEGITVTGDRESFKRTVKWRKQTGVEVLEEKTLPGRWIPIVPVYWTSVVIDGKLLRCGLVKDMIDPARMNNFWQTAITESLALAPKAKWLIAEGQDEGHDLEFKNANLSSNAVLRYKQTDVDGEKAPPPQRIAPEMPPQGFVEAAFLANQNLSRVAGVFDPAVRGGAQHKSDKTLNAERSQSENTNFDGYDNLTRSMKHSYRIILSWIPTTFDTARIQRIIGEDGREEMIQLNERTQVPDPNGMGAAIEKVLNDVRIGTYDVVMETGPGYDTRRQEGVAATMELLNTPIGEKVAETADDLIVRAMDFPGADMIADRLAAANPLSQIDEKSDIPPAVQMKLKGAQQMIEQLQGQLQAAGIEIKFGLQKEQMKQDGETRRALMKETSDAHEREITQAQKQHDTETYAVTAQNVAEINALAKLLTSKTEHGQRLREMIQEFEHSTALMDQEQKIKAAEVEPVGTVQ